MKNLEEMILGDIKKINISVENELNRTMTSLGLTASQGHVLIHILNYAGDGMSATDLHQHLELSRATVSGLLKKLRMKGYIEFKDDRSDNRLKMIMVTEKGSQLKAQLDDQLNQAAVIVYHGFSDQELLMLNHLQKKILTNLYEQNWLRRKKR